MIGKTEQLQIAETKIIKKPNQPKKNVLEEFEKRKAESDRLNLVVVGFYF